MEQFEGKKFREVVRPWAMSFCACWSYLRALVRECLWVAGQKPVASLAAALDGNCTNNSAFRPFTPCPMLQFIIVVRTELNSLLYWLSQGGDVPQNGLIPPLIKPRPSG